MTLPLDLGGIHDEYVRRALERVDQAFPVTATNAFGAGPTTTATLPTGAVNGQDFYYQLGSGGGVWHFKYNLSSGKWDLAGGAPLFAEVVTSETTASVTYAALATAGPSVTVPFVGDYDVEIGFGGNNAGGVAIMSYDIGGTGAVDADFVISATNGANTNHGSRTRRKTGLAASTALVSKYRANAGTGTFRDRWISVLPVRVG